LICWNIVSNSAAFLGARGSSGARPADTIGITAGINARNNPQAALAAVLRNREVMICSSFQNVQRGPFRHRVQAFLKATLKGSPYILRKVLIDAFKVDKAGPPYGFEPAV